MFDKKLEVYEEDLDDSMLFNKWIKDQPQEEHVESLLVSDVTYGLARKIDITCKKCITDNRFKKHKATIDPEKTTKYASTRSILCQYAINLQFCFVSQSMGVSGEHASILTAFQTYRALTNGLNNFPRQKNLRIVHWKR